MEWFHSIQIQSSTLSKTKKSKLKNKMLHNNTESTIKAIGCFIFGGSQTIGHLKAGWNVDRVLEMTENMKEINSAHFVRNYPDIPIVLPSEWEAEGYLESLKGKYDLFFANNPCSGLSRINIHASADNPTNDHFYDVFAIIKKIEPKMFFLENAPTLVSYGTPILKKMVDIIGDDYRFTIIRDKAANHGVCMQRMRTFVVGWSRKHFDKIPLVHMNHEKKVTLNEIISKSLHGVANCEPDPKKTQYRDLIPFYKHVKPGESVLRMSIRMYDELKDKFPERWLKLVNHEMDKLKRKSGIWDKSAVRQHGDSYAQSMTSLTYMIHPTEDRDLYVREYARIMGYPDEFVFYPDASEVSCVQACAQGVPVNFIWYISKELRRIFEGVEVEYSADETKDLVFQNHSAKNYYAFTKDEFKALPGDLLTTYDVKNSTKIEK